jgi:hypothetical protein
MAKPQPTDQPTAARRAARELLTGVLLIGFGVGLLPLLVYAAGAATLGPYDGGLGQFLPHFYGDLAGLSPGALALVLGPYVVFVGVRFLTRPLRRRPE